jgi:hypothetical protein
MAVALGLGAEWPDHLRVAVVAALTDVDIAAHKSKRAVVSESCHRLGGGLLKEQRHDLYQTAHTNYQQN